MSKAREAHVGWRWCVTLAAAIGATVAVDAIRAFCLIGMAGGAVWALYSGRFLQAKPWRAAVAFVVLFVLAIPAFFLLRYVDGVFARQSVAVTTQPSVPPGTDPSPPLRETPEPIPAPVKSTLQIVPLQIVPLFKDSPLFTEKRKDRIGRELDSYYVYLRRVGFEIPKETPAIGVTRVSPMLSAAGPGAYEAEIFIREALVDNPDEVVQPYSA